MEDGKIVDLYFERDETAITHTADKYGRSLRSLALGITEDMRTAEECENDTYFKAWNAIPPHDPSEYLFAFLARITRNLALGRLRADSRKKRSAHIAQLSAELEQCIPAPDDTPCRVDERLLREALNRFLGSLSEAKNDADFGNYIPSLPHGFVLENARRYKDYRNDYLSVLWCRGLEDVTWRVRRYTEADAVRLTSVEDTQNYDMSLYSIPLAETVPEQLLGIVQDPLFQAKDLTLDVVKARLFNGHYTFSVKYGDIVVQVNAAADVGAEWIYEQLTALQK